MKCVSNRIGQLSQVESKMMRRVELESMTQIVTEKMNRIENGKLNFCSCSRIK